MTTQKNLIGVLLTNLGTPETPTRKAVKKYLREFLSDPYVIQIPRVPWWFILNFLILPWRPRKSAHLYKKIWTEEGSPLLVLSQMLLKNVQTALDDKRLSFELALGMRYGKPSIKEALADLRQKQIDKLIILPLYPQFSTTTTASTKQHINDCLMQLGWQPKQQFINHYAEEPSYIDVVVKSIQDHWHYQKRGQKLLFSFHGIPKKYIKKGDIYFEQCQATANQIASLLQLDRNEWELVFQSRFGRAKWLQPYIKDRLNKLPSEGCEELDVICPGFAVDCLETLEEIAITNKAFFLEAGGKSYSYIPALNTSDNHCACLAEIILSKFNQF